MAATTSLLESSIFDPSLTDAKIMWGLHHPYQTIIGKSAERQVLWKSVKCVLWFPDFEIYGYGKMVSNKNCLEVIVKVLECSYSREHRHLGLVIK